MDISKKAWNEFYSKYYGQLIGATVVDVGVSEDGFPYLKFGIPSEDDRVRRMVLARMHSGGFLKAEISQDEEGNGAGFLFLGEADDKIPRVGDDPGATALAAKIWKEREEDGANDGVSLNEFLKTNNGKTVLASP